MKTTSKTVDIKGKVTVYVKSVKPANASKSVTWKSSNIKKVKATIKITVKDYKPKSVSLSKKTLSLMEFL